MWIIYIVRILTLAVALGRNSMIPAARISAAIEVLSDIDARRRPAPDALKDWGLSHRFAGSSDRAAIAGLVYDALRRKASSAFVMGETTPRAVMLGMLRLERELDVDAIAKLFDGSRFAPQPLSEAEQRTPWRGQSRRCAAAYRGRLSGMARSVFRRDLRRGAGGGGCGAGRARAARSAGQSAEVGSRQRRLPNLPNTIRNRPAGRPGGLRIRIAPDAKSPAIQSEPAFIKGHVEIQDEGSQLAALAVGRHARRAGGRSVRRRRRQDAGAGGDDGEQGPDLRDRYRQAPACADPCAAGARRRARRAGPHAARRRRNPRRSDVAGSISC